MVVEEYLQFILNLNSALKPSTLHILSPREIRIKELLYSHCPSAHAMVVKGQVE